MPFTLRISFLAFSLFYCSAVFSIAVFWKIPDRVLSPVVITYIATAVLFSSSFFDRLKGKRKAPYRLSPSNSLITSLWIITCLALVFAVYKKLPITEAEARNIAEISTLREIINGQLVGKIVVFTFNASQGFLSHQRLSSVSHLSPNNQYILVDGTWPTLLPEFPQRLKEITGSDRLSDVFEYLARNREKVIFVSTPNRNAFIQEYFASIYRTQYTFEELKFPNVPLNSVGVGTDPARGIGFYTMNANAA